MRQLVLSLGLSVAVLIPTSGMAQVYLLPAEPPQVTAASTAWQINGEPVFYAGDYYYPAGPTVFFDGNVMVRSGTYRGVPLYADSTLEPYSVILVPIGGKLLRPYERKRTGELAGTVGSRTPSFPTPRVPPQLQSHPSSYRKPSGPLLNPNAQWVPAARLCRVRHDRRSSRRSSGGTRAPRSSRLVRGPAPTPACGSTTEARDGLSPDRP